MQYQKQYLLVLAGNWEMKWFSPCLNFHLMFAGCTAVQSSAPPCVLPGPSGAARRSPHRPWDREPCCAGPPVCPGPVGKDSYRLPLSLCFETRTSNVTLTCVVRIILYRSSLGAGAGGGSAAGFLTKESCFMLPRILLAFDFCKGDFWNWALWSSRRRAWAVATSSKNSSLCSDVTEEKMTAETGFRQWGETTRADRSAPGVSGNDLWSLPLLAGLTAFGSEWHLLLTLLSSLKEQRWSLSRLPSWRVQSSS